MKKTKLQQIPTSRLVTLKRNPQFMTPKQMESLKASMKRDGFVAPILVRPLKGGRYEVISGNHRFMAAQELGLPQVPCVISDMSAAAAKRLAVNLNTIHGEPNAELLAPFLADMDDTTLAEIHLDDKTLADCLQFDAQLKARLDALEIPEAVDTPSPTHANPTCVCPTCGKTHPRGDK